MIIWLSRQVRDLTGLELFSHSAYNQLHTETCFSQVSNNTPLCLHLHFKVNYSFD